MKPLLTKINFVKRINYLKEKDKSQQKNHRRRNENNKEGLFGEVRRCGKGGAKWRNRA